jgi:hypothetical protein
MAKCKRHNAKECDICGPVEEVQSSRTPTYPDEQDADIDIQFDHLPGSDDVPEETPESPANES